MASQVTGIQIDGAARLRRTLRQAGVDMAQMKELNREAADTAKASAARKVPRGPTGRLAASLRVGATQRAGILRAGRAAVPYAGPIHWGWPARGIKPNTFMVDGAKDTESTWIPNYVSGIQKMLDRIEGQ